MDFTGRLKSKSNHLIKIFFIEVISRAVQCWYDTETHDTTASTMSFINPTGVCVCVCERERESVCERERERERKRERESDSD